MPFSLHFSKRVLVTAATLVYSLCSPVPHDLHAEPVEKEFPRVFQPDEIQHGFSAFDTLPDIPEQSPKSTPDPSPDSDLQPPIDTDAPPEGLFYQIDFAKDYEEKEGIRRGHYVIPMNPTKEFATDVGSVFMVFRVHQHYAPYQVFGRVYPENVEGGVPSTLVDEDTMYLATEDESGYLQFAHPDGLWPVGSYRVLIYVGYEASEFNLRGTVRFSIISANEIRSRDTDAQPHS